MDSGSWWMHLVIIRVFAWAFTKLYKAKGVFIEIYQINAQRPKSQLHRSEPSFWKSGTPESLSRNVFLVKHVTWPFHALKRGSWWDHGARSDWHRSSMLVHINKTKGRQFCCRRCRKAKKCWSEASSSRLGGSQGRARQWATRAKWLQNGCWESCILFTTGGPSLHSGSSLGSL